MGTMKENVVEVIKQFFDTDRVMHDYEAERSPHRTGMNMGTIGQLDIAILIRDNYYLVYALFSSTAEEEQYARVSEYLHMANYGLNNGNFEFDFSDGEIRYKTYVNFNGLQLSKDIVEDSILIPVFMFDTYGRNLVRLMLGESDPKTLIDEVEAKRIREREARKTKSDSKIQQLCAM